ncbi:MAG: biopolymer transporter ExbD [Planctomycetota bacterium]
MPLKIKKTDDSSINLTPLIDIVFLLIIFFMVGTRFSELNEMERNIPLQVPTVSDASALTSAPKKRVINVLKDGQIVLDGRDVSIQQLKQEIRSAKDQYQNLGVVIRGDGDAIYQRVTDVIATCKNAEISDLNISVRTAGQAQAPRSSDLR